MSVQIPKAYFPFLKELKENNHKDWMDAHKNVYKNLESDFKTFCKATVDELNTFDQIARVKVFRINRDVRFSKNKMPYKTTRSAIFSREGVHRRGSYYFQIAPGASFVGGGFFKPEPVDLLRIRKEFELDSEPIREILSEAKFKKAYGGFNTESQVKTAPKGFSKEDANIDLIRNKNFFVRHAFTDEEVLADDFQERLVAHFKLLLPFFDYMSEVLTTDLNGESIL
ncbi:putative protein (TIGR02453 family) [Leeuwenhoekiella aestuarii]|uniref:TIGR02453 family protein n=1 Tax=Leeuwenhoekiella aestuarii TaxID=2249426 RepID=A0A4Q0NW19_9FLAO|nr:DUF2461 domain-containing protein [Leeuwenhoekiella aestuarii]RXG15287.1 putative protein (TIGR02453 family) [Leeuwenhoekiella aestuarii]RXG17606.1 putative protein (TIGR02453 family) [Leeuwenhoekiella aestuarii]